MLKKTIAVLPGDGIGPEVMKQSLRVLDAISEIFGLSFRYNQGSIGGQAYSITQDHCPKETLQLCEESDAVLFGSVGGPVHLQHLPQWKNCERNSILKLRKHFNLTINLRPVALYQALAHQSPLKPETLGKNVNFLIFRELSGGIYFGRHEHSTSGNKRQAFDSCEYNEEQIKTIAHAAFKAAQQKNGRLCSVDKANVLATSQLWREIMSEVANDYPDVELTHMLVDNCAMQMILHPQQFDILVTENMFGDILSDLGAALPGSLGLLPSTSLNAEGFGLYEPSGGSAPDIAGKNIANPCAQILSAAMMLRHSFACHEAASAIESAIQHTIEKGIATRDIAKESCESVGTIEFTNAVIKHIQTSEKR